jgi:hypothetical protein
MDDRPIDFTPLDPTLDAERWERRISTIAALAAPELARRAAGAWSPSQVLAGWLRPALAAAAVLALCAAAALSLLPGPSPEPPVILAEDLRLPAPVSLWLGDDQPPTVADVALAVHGSQP